MKVHFIQHESFEAPGAYLEWAMARGYQVSFSKVYEYQPLPDEHAIQNLDLLVILGGPQSPSTMQAECPYFDSQAEQTVLKRAIDAGKAVVGACLGAQLIGESLGATYEHSPEREIGNFPIRLNRQGLDDPLLSHFGESTVVGHWHNDMPGLTPNAQILAASAGCPRQIVKYSALVYGFQCHPELTPDVVRQLIAAQANLVEQSQQHRFVQHPDEILLYDYREMNEKLWLFLDRLIEAYRQTTQN